MLVRMMRGELSAIKKPILKNRGVHPHVRKYEDKVLNIKGNLRMIAAKARCEKTGKVAGFAILKCQLFSAFHFCKQQGLLDGNFEDHAADLSLSTPVSGGWKLRVTEQGFRSIRSP